VIFAFACAAMLLVTLGVLLFPLLRGWKAEDGIAFDRSVYRAQLAELEEDRGRGLIATDEAEAARVEIARRLLATERPQAPPRGAAANPALAALLAALLTATGGGIYLLRGAPDLEPRGPGAERAALAEQARTLAEQTRRDPRDAAAWLNLGRTSAALGRWDMAVAAYRAALALRPGAAPLLGALGEALTMQAGRVTDDARQVFAQAPEEISSRFYLAQAQAEAGDAAAAIAAWQKLAGDLPAAAPIRAEIARRADAAARQAGLPPPALPAGAAGPDEEAMAAAARLPPEQRAAMVRGMVARLAERMQRAPGDPEGWLRLGRAYLMLGEAEKADAAYDRAAALRPGEQVRLQQIAAIFEVTPLDKPLPERLRALLAQAAARAPKEPEVLWYEGMLAARSGQREEALKYWRELLALLPAASGERKLVQSAVDALTER
jgi:cytochrome c-type biogenesis protein CcmH